MSNETVSTISSMNESSGTGATGIEAQAVCPTSPQRGCSVPPSASTESVSAHAIVNAESKRLMVVSPVEVVKGSGRVPAGTDDYTPQSLEDFERFCALVRKGLLIDATELCRERLLTARDETVSLIWTKDLAIVKRAEGDYDSAFNLHLSVYSIAQRTKGILRGKFENGFGRTFELLKKYDPAFGHYTAARYFYEQEGDVIRCAGVDNNVGRLLTSTNRPEESFDYFKRAELIANQFNDVRLLGEIYESRSLALLAQHRFKEAQEAASRSVSLLFGTEHGDALVESIETRGRIESLRLLNGKEGDAMRRL